MDIKVIFDDKPMISTKCHFWYLGWYLRRIFGKSGYMPNTSHTLVHVEVYAYCLVKQLYKDGMSIIKIIGYRYKR